MKDLLDKQLDRFTGSNREKQKACIAMESFRAVYAQCYI